MSWFVYIVRCSDNSLYTGITTNVERRINEHNTKIGAKSLYGKLPVQLVYIEKGLDKKIAGNREREIKGWRKEKKEELVKNLGLVVFNKKRPSDRESK